MSCCWCGGGCLTCRGFSLSEPSLSHGYCQCACRMRLECTCSSVLLQNSTHLRLITVAPLLWLTITPHHKLHTTHTFIHTHLHTTHPQPLSSPRPIMHINSPTSRQHRVEQIKQVMVSPSNMLLWALFGGTLQLSVTVCKEQRPALTPLLHLWLFHVVYNEPSSTEGIEGAQRSLLWSLWSLSRDSCVEIHLDGGGISFWWPHFDCYCQYLTSRMCALVGKSRTLHLYVWVPAVWSEFTEVSTDVSMRWG